MLGTGLKMIVLIHSTNLQKTPTSPERVLSIHEVPNICSFYSAAERRQFTLQKQHEVGAHHVVARVLRDDAASPTTNSVHSTIEGGVSREESPSSSPSARNLTAICGRSACAMCSGLASASAARAARLVVDRSGSVAASAAAFAHVATTSHAPWSSTWSPTGETWQAKVSQGRRYASHFETTPPTQT